MKIITLVLLTTVLLSSQIFSQQYFIKGKVLDKSGAAVISFANIRVINSTIGTAANKEGEFELKLQRGNYKLIASCIGYNSDTLSIRLNKDLSGNNFYLEQTNINLPAITVFAGENPAIRIIKRAIEKKKERANKVLSYEFEAYTKGIIKTQKEISSHNGGVALGLDKDTSALKITGILENESKGYFKKPSYYKEEIIARKQSSNFPSSVNVIAGGRILKNFYDEKIDVLGKEIPGPLADNSLQYYDFYIRNTVAINKDRVYQIYMSPQDASDPGFVGNIFITDSTFDLIKVDLQVNRAANTGGLFDTLNVFQQFTLIADSIYMPVDYRLFVNINFLDVAKVGIELNTVLYDYKINPPIDDDFFNKAVITVLPDADKHDSTYWNKAITIPNTVAERAAYKRIDSLSSIPSTFWGNFNFLSTRIAFSDNFSISAPLGMYHFNRVEGNSLDFGFFLDNALEQRLNSDLKLSYGFSDKKYKSIFNGSYLFGDYRTYKISFNAYNKLAELFGNSDNYNDLMSTFLALVSKYEFKDYYYSKGLSTDLSGEVFPILSLNAGFFNHTDNSAIKNSDFSIFSRDKKFVDNPPIYDTRISALTAGFKLDFRNYIEDGFFRRRISRSTSYATLDGEIIFSNSGFLKSNMDFTTYKVNVEGTINTFNSAQLNFKMFGMYNQGELPYQALYSLPGNIDLTAQSFSFRTLNFNEILGDRVVTINLEHDFGDELFRLINISALKKWELQFSTFLNIAYSDAGSKTKSISPYPLTTLTHPFYEAGFEIGQVMFPMQLDFAWRLNYRGENNFRIGINTFIIQ